MPDRVLLSDTYISLGKTISVHRIEMNIYVEDRTS